MAEKQHYLWQSDPNNEWGEVRTNYFNLNPNMNKRFWVVDNFYEDPDAVRKFALEQTYYPGEGAVGHRTRKQYFIEGVKEKFEEIIQMKIKSEGEHCWNTPGINGRFQYCEAGTIRVVHCDEQQYAGLIFLTPNAPPVCGTTFFRHKGTGRRHSEEIDWASGEGGQVFPGDTFKDLTRYEPVDVVGNVYNRCVIFDGHLIHSATEYFGSNQNNCRLHQMFFFNVEK
jgi:hypothetical protein